MKRRRNTKLAKKISYIAFVTNVIFGTLGRVADFFGAESGFSEHKEFIFYILNIILSFLVAYRNWALLVTGILLIIIILNKKYEKDKKEERQTKSLSWFDAHQRNTEFSGGNDYIYKLKCFLKQKNIDFSWWAISGVAGIGKTRLVLEVLKNDEFSNADIQWLKEFDDYRENALKKRVDDILESVNLKNIIIAEDAQIYMDNIGSLINYIVGKDLDEIGDHNIRLLILIRMGEDEDLTDRFKQLESKSYQSRVSKTRYNEFGEYLLLDKYSEAVIEKVVKSYVINTRKKQPKHGKKKLTTDQIADIQLKTLKVLKSERVDSKHLRPLFAMFIADALLSDKEAMSWDLQDVLEYAVKDREDDFLELEVRDLLQNNNRFVFEKVRGIISLSIIRSGLDLSELNGIQKELEAELSFSGLSLMDFLTEMQLMGHDGNIRIHMPDILSEYYVLRTLILKPDDRILPWIVERLCATLVGVQQCRKKVRQNFRYLYGDIKDEIEQFYNKYFEKCSDNVVLEIINIILSEKDLLDSNEIIIHKAISNILLSESKNSPVFKKIGITLLDIILHSQDYNERRIGLTELMRLPKKIFDNIDIAQLYANVLLIVPLNNIILENTLIQSDNNLTELKHLYELHPDDTGIVQKYCLALYNMFRASDEAKSKLQYYKDIKKLAESKRGFLSNYDSNSEAYQDIILIIGFYILSLKIIISYTDDTNWREKSILEVKNLTEEYPELKNFYQEGIEFELYFDKVSYHVRTTI